MYFFESNYSMDIITENHNYDIRKDIQNIRKIIPETIKNAQEKQKICYDK